MPCSDGPLGGYSFNSATYKGLIELLAADRTTVIRTLRDYSQNINLVEHCEFTILRQGGCGEGTLRLTLPFEEDSADEGLYVRCSYASGDPWFLGKVLEVSAEEPSGQNWRLYGLFEQVDNLQVGGLGSGDCRGPHLMADTNRFPQDPDRDIQSWDIAVHWNDLVQYIYDGYIAPETGIGLDVIEAPDVEVDFRSMVFRGEETVGQVLRTIAVAEWGASYGVDADGEFYWLKPRTTGLARFQQGLHTTKLSRSTDRSLLMNRIFLTGDNIYEDIFTGPLIDTIEKILSAATGGHFPNKPYRFLKAYCDEASIAAYGPKTRAIHAPMIRTDEDAQAFIDGLLDKYAQPVTRYTFTTTPQSVLLEPALGYICLLDKNGDTLAFEQFDQLKVVFNEAPYFEITTGPEELQFPEPPPRQRWELPNAAGGGVDTSNEFSYTASDTDTTDPSTTSPCIDFTTGTHDAELIEELVPATDPLTGPSLCLAKWIAQDPGDPTGDWIYGCEFYISNRSLDASGNPGDYCVVTEIDNEWRIVWIDC